MKHLKVKIKAETPLLSAALLALFLFGCSPAPERKAAQPDPAPVAAEGHIENGRDLFMGYVHLQNGGPPCMGCHSVGDNGLLGGGAMGPNLTDVSTRLNQAELVSVLSNSGPKISPVMEPIYAKHPLTASEQADLIAFLNASVGQVEVDKEPMVVAVSLVGFVAIAAFLGFIYRNRLRSVRGALVKTAEKELP
ncbi:MAG: c-type cytochrome [Anaerolineales bacterium]|nr:MAG: c-type cytochrome [Anaerolineales bacterium]